MTKGAGVGARARTALAGGLTLLALGLPWVPAQSQRVPGSGPSCIPDLSGQGGMICDYIGTPDLAITVPAVAGTASPARVLLVLALVLVVWSLLPRRTTTTPGTTATPGTDPTGPARTARLLAAGACVLAVGLGLPAVLSGQVVTLAAAGLLLLACGVRSSAGAVAQVRHVG